jgi:hypothetical protein
MPDHTHAEENSHAGQGPVLLDIGGDVGALIVDMPAGLEGVEIEIRPVGHDHDGARLQHVGVVGRPADGKTLYTAVFGQLSEGRYELYERPDGPVKLQSSITGGMVAYATWPS